MNDEGTQFFGGMIAGVFLAMAALAIVFAIFGHITVDTMDEIETPTMYKVTVDGIETMCKSEPEVERNYLTLWSCDSMPDSNMRVRRYLDLTVVEVPGE